MILSLVVLGILVILVVLRSVSMLRKLWETWLGKTHVEINLSPKVQEVLNKGCGVSLRSKDGYEVMLVSRVTFEELVRDAGDDYVERRYDP